MPDSTFFFYFGLITSVVEDRPCQCIYLPFFFFVIINCSRQQKEKKIQCKVSLCGQIKTIKRIHKRLNCEVNKITWSISCNNDLLTAPTCAVVAVAVIRLPIASLLLLIKYPFRRIHFAMIYSQLSILFFYFWAGWRLPFMASVYRCSCVGVQLYTR